jgi:hypothetical protein
VVTSAYPMVRAGGLFIMIMGVGVVLGSLFPRQRKLLLGAGGAVASVALLATAAELSRPLGSPTTTQVGALVGAIVLEIALIGLAVARYRQSGERRFYLAILLAVGIHFLPMAFAFGPACALLGIAAAANAGAALWVVKRPPLGCFWLIDGVLKVLFGGWMLLA